MLRAMRRFVMHYRKAGFALLAMFTMQLVAAGFCAFPSAQATPATTHEAMPMDVINVQCAMDMPMTDGQEMPDCAHCKTPDFSAFANQVNDLPATWTLIAVLSGLPLEVNAAPDQERPVLLASQDPPRSSSLIFQTSLRIRL